jgi:hypothetical protein
VRPATLDAARTQRSPPAKQPKTGMLQAIFNVDEGPVIVIAPATLSETSSAALADLFELFLRRVKSDAS